MVFPGARRVGALPPMVTVTVSIDCLPLPAVMTSSPHRVACPGAPVVLGFPYCTCCWTAQAGTLPGTVTVMEVSDQLVMVVAAPPMVTLDLVLQVGLPAVGLVHWPPKP